MRLRYTGSLFVAALFVFAPSALAAKRFALLIGNQSYARQVGELKNPINDVKRIKSALIRIGFEDDNIKVVENADRLTLLASIDDYADKLKSAGNQAVGFLYYSGHGAANKRDRRNYLIPVGVKKLDGRVWYQAVALDSVIETLGDIAPSAAHFVVFDACRNLLNTPTRGGKGFVPTQSRRGMLIAFSTDPGETASDEGRESGPYAEALAAELVKPGLDHLSLFQNVKERVIKLTKVQVPWTRDGMLQRVYLSGRRTPPAATSNLLSAESAWLRIEKSRDAADFNAFRQQYGKSNPFLDRLAEKRLAALVKSNQGGQCSGINVRLSTGGQTCIAPGSGQSFRDCAVCPDMVVIPPGTARLGSDENEAGRDQDEGPRKTFTLKSPIAVGKYEVTRAQFDRFVRTTGYRPSGNCLAFKDKSWSGQSGRDYRSPGFKQAPDEPVVCIDWATAGAYAQWLSNQTGKPYRLLSEAEWEYAVRAGSTARFHFGNNVEQLCRYGNSANAETNFTWSNQACRDGSDSRTARVGQHRPNAFGLHDMTGNVWEWVRDCYKPAISIDGEAKGGAKCAQRSVRGGSWIDFPGNLRSANRSRMAPERIVNNVGFRVGLTLAPDAN